VEKEMPINVKSVPEVSRVALRNTTTQELQSEADGEAQSNPVMSQMLNSIIQNVKARPGFNPNNAISVSAHFGLHGGVQAAGEQE
jgi:hypothetical protein